MFNFYLLIGIIFISLLFFIIGHNEAKNIKKINNIKLHSLSHYYGIFVLLTSLLPSLGMYFIFTIGDDLLFASLIQNYVPIEVVNSEDYNFTIVLAQIKNSVEGLIFGTPDQWVTDAAEVWKSWVYQSQILTSISCIFTAIISGFLGYRKINHKFRY